MIAEAPATRPWGAWTRRGPRPVPLADVPNMNALETTSDRRTSLALAYQAGDSSVLPLLYEAVGPIVRTALADVFQQTQHGAWLPGSLEWADVEQSAWTILARLAQRWNSERGPFGAYLRASFAWELRWSVQRQRSQRYRDGVQVLSVEHDDAQEQADAQLGVDGRSWATSVALKECLASLPDRERRVVILVELGGLGIAETARRLGAARRTVYRLHRRALASLRAWWIEGEAFPAPEAPPLVRVLRVLLEEHGRRAVLPGRATVCREAQVSQKCFNRKVMPELVRLGVVLDRSERQPGRLDRSRAREVLRERERQPCCSTTG